MNKFILVVIISLLTHQAFTQKNLSLLANLPYNTQLSNIWGYVDDNGNEYALVGTEDGVSIVDVSTPTNPVEVKSIHDTASIWRELKVWNKHAYVTNETGNGLLIIDLSSLPNASGITYQHYTGGGMTTGHTIFIDENGVAYVFGTDVAQGALILDLTIPNSPTILGSYTDNYIHDGYVRGDTLWAGAIYAGKFLVLDMSVKSAPVLLSSQTTPGVFTHNCWLSDNGKYLFTTDEVTNSYVTSYDVSDLSNIKELDRYQSNPGSDAIVHNTYVVNTDYLVNAYYKDGVTIVDATYPGNMIEVGNYDTYSQGSGDGMTGCWGVYPYLPSGNILASDMINGLFILKPNYKKACYVEGKVTDQTTTASLYGVNVEIVTTTNNTLTGLTGDYASGVSDAGSYDIIFSKAGYFPDTQTVSLASGIVTTLNVQLKQKLTYTVSVDVKDKNGNSIQDAFVSIANTDFDYSGTTNSSGNYQDTGVYENQYEIVVGKWGYLTQCLTQQDIPTTTSFSITLEEGYYDDFSFDFGWTVLGTAQSGEWERGEPIGTEYTIAGDANPEYDSNGDCSDKCFITGNAGGTSSNDDVDNGYTLLTSPVFDLSGYTHPFISYATWFFNKGGQGNPNDSLIIYLSNGSTTVVLETLTKSNIAQSEWVNVSYKISNFISPTSTMQVMVYTSDQDNTGHLVEAGFDQFQITEDSVLAITDPKPIYSFLSVYPNPSYSSITLAYNFPKELKLIEPGAIITNSVGQKIIDLPLVADEGNLFISERLPAGIYYVSLTNNKGIITSVKAVIIE